MLCHSEEAVRPTWESVSLKKQNAKAFGDADCHSRCEHWLRNDKDRACRQFQGGTLRSSLFLSICGIVFWRGADTPLTDAEIDQMADSIAYTEIH